jgi:positive regulator of sigma E activity
MVTPIPTNEMIQYWNDTPLNVTSPDIVMSPAQFMALKQIILDSHIFWMRISFVLGFICAVLCIKIVMDYRKKKAERDEYEQFMKEEEERKHGTV